MAVRFTTRKRGASTQKQGDTAPWLRPIGNGGPSHHAKPLCFHQITISQEKVGVLAVLQVERVEFVGSAIDQHYDAVVGCELEPPTPAEHGTQEWLLTGIGNFFFATVKNAVAIDLVRIAHRVHVSTVMRPRRPSHFSGVGGSGKLAPLIRSE